MSPLFTVPEAELTPEYIPLPTGHYDADFVGAEVVGNENGWRAIAPTFENFALSDGSNTVKATHKGREIEVQLRTRRKTTRFTVESHSAKAVEIGGRDIIKLADALGVATREDGSVSVAGDTPEEIVDTLNAARGKRVRVSIRLQPRKRNKEVVVGDDGQPILDDEVVRVWQPGV